MPASGHGTITGGFWKDRLALNRAVSMPSVFATFERTGRVRAVEGTLRPGEKHHVFYESDLAKWMEAVFIDARNVPDTALLKTAEEVFDKIIANQQDDGYLNSFFTRHEPAHRLTNLRIRHELYCAGHLLEAAVAHAALDPGSRFLAAMERYVDFMVREFGRGEGQRRGYPGHQELEMALTRAFDATGREKFRDLAYYFIDERGRDPKYFEIEYAREEELIAAMSAEERLGASAQLINAHKDNHRIGNGWIDDHRYAQAHVPPVEQDAAVGHAVRALYMYSGMADLARQYDDKALLAASKRIWRNIVDRQMYVHGGTGSNPRHESFSFDYDLPNDTAYAETCAGIALIFFAERMSRIERNSEYADIIERALYNNVLAGVSLDGRGFFYSNYLECDPEFLRTRDMRHGKRDEYHSCSCCPPNVLRLFADLDRYVFSEVDDGLEVHQFIDCTRTIRRGDADIGITQVSGFPWKSETRISVSAARGEHFRMYLRVPHWDRNVRIEVNGVAQRPEMDGGYAVIDRAWRDGDEVEMHFDFTPKVVRSNVNVRYNVGRVAVFRGPLLYCLERADNEHPLNAIRLRPDAGLIETRMEMDSRAVGLRAKARVVTSGDAALYSTEPRRLLDTDAVLVPYFMWANRGENEMLVWINED